MRLGIHALGPIHQDTGGRTYFHNLVKYGHLAPSDLQILIFASKGQHGFLPPLPPCMRIVHVPLSHQHSLLRAIAENLLLPFFILFYRIEVMYFPGNYAPALTPVPYLLAIRSMLTYNERSGASVDPARQLYRKFILPRSARHASRIITPSAHTKREIVHYLRVHENSVTVLPHGIDHEVFNAQESSPPSSDLRQLGILSPYILYVSALWQYKNHDKLIDAYAELVHVHKVAHQLVLVGKGMNSYSSIRSTLLSRVSSMHLEHRVLFIDFLPHDVLRWVYKNADLFVFPSEIESFGNSIFEAMACNIPVVCSNLHGFPEMLGEAALLVDPHDRTNFVQALWTALTDAGLRSRLRTNGHELVKKLSWEKTVPLTFQFAASCAGDRP